MKNLKGNVAVVTGAANGIGLGLAEEFAAEGMKVVLSEGVDVFRWTKVVHSRLDDIRECRNPVFVNPDEISKNE